MFRFVAREEINSQILGVKRFNYSNRHKESEYGCILCVHVWKVQSIEVSHSDFLNNETWL